MRTGLLGEHLAHSFSPRIHALLGNPGYKLFEVAPEALDTFMQSGCFDALNVTIPYKRAVISYCAALTNAARGIGSVNTIVRRADGMLLGDNTDAAGFRGMLARLNVDLAGKKALVLGSGGASRTAQYVLREAGCGEVIVISRSGENNYANLYLHADARLLVNATPVGMYPNCGVSPVNLDVLPQLEGVLDLIYNPARTRLLLDAEARGIPCANGLFMLAEQARKAAERFTGTEIDLARSEEIRKTLSAETLNLILIGMPGCGKSTLGAILAEQSGRRFADADAEIEKKTGIPVPDFIRANGEGAFRAMESAVLAELGRESGLVIATGGGCVARAENRDLLRQNGIIIFVQRDLSLLPTDGRPLSQSSRLGDLYRARLPLYREFAEAEILNDAAPEIVAAQIWEAFHEISDR